MSTNDRPTVLVLMAHPDDAEILCGGTLALLAAARWDVHIAAMAPGDCGTPDLPPDEIAAIRRGEGRAAASILGGTWHCLEARDLLVFYNETMVRRANALLRRVRPHLVIAHSPQDYMPDHEQASLIARAACFNGAVPNAPVEALPEDGGGALEQPDPPAPRIPHLYYADPTEGKDHSGRPVRPELCVDISGCMDTKERLVGAHASQREWLRRHHAIDEFIDAMKRWGAERGSLIGVPFAEGFRQHRGHAFPADDLLRKVLGAKARWLGTGLGAER